MLLALLDFLNSREDATVTWAAVIIVIVLAASRGAILSSFADVIRALAPKLLLVFSGAAGYCGLVVFVAALGGLWHRGTLKETVYWFAVSGVGMTAYAIEKSPRGFGYLREFLRRAVALTIIAEFIVNLYVLPLFFELLIFPFFLWLAYAQVASRQSPETRKLVGGMTSYLGLVLVSYVALRAATDLNGLLTRGTLERLLVAPALTIAFVPFLYAIGLIVRREQESLRKSFRPRVA